MDDLFDKVSHCPNPICPYPKDEKKEALYFDESPTRPRITVRVACQCGVSGPWYQRDNPRTAAKVAVDAWNMLPRTTTAEDDGCIRPTVNEMLKYLEGTDKKK